MPKCSAAVNLGVYIVHMGAIEISEEDITRITLNWVASLVWTMAEQRSGPTQDCLLALAKTLYAIRNEDLPLIGADG